MKFALIPILLFTLTPHASAVVNTYTSSGQNVTLTGIGANATGAGQSRVSWGACAFDGTNTTCTVSAPYTGVGGGGTISMILAYPGNGQSPLTAISTFPGSNQIFFNLSAGSLIVKLAPNSGPALTFYDPDFFFDYDNATCTGVAAPVCGTAQVGITPNSTITGTIHGTFDSTPFFRSSLGVITAGNYGAYTALAPGTWMEIYGTNLATVLSQVWDNGFQGNQAPTAVGGTTVTIGGLPAYISYVSPHQVNAQVPSGVATGPQNVVVTTAGGTSAIYTITVNALEPGLLAPPVFRLPAGQYVAALFPDGVTFVLPPIAGAPTQRARAGDTIVFYGIGFGPVTPDSPAGIKVTQANNLKANFQASFAGVPATVAFAGLTAGFLGLYQFNVVVPNVAASDAVPFTYTLNGVAGPQNLITAIR